MLQEYVGDLGKFTYDDADWSVSTHIHWIGGDKRCNLPKGVKNCAQMFKGCVLGKGFVFGDFDTKDVTNMSLMFDDCTLPDGFTLGDMFDTSSVTDMRYMFRGCSMPKGFTLGSKFDTSKVEYMDGMFWSCKLPDDFTLGDNFSMQKVEECCDMFKGCTLPLGFIIPEPRSFIHIYEMFAHTVLPSDFIGRNLWVVKASLQCHSMFLNSFIYDEMVGSHINTQLYCTAITTVSYEELSKPKYDFSKLGPEFAECRSMLDLLSVIKKSCLVSP